ncbi:MAG: trigger factor [Lachnospiraceae bacterium]|nr:trigger factor [Lachnospiraceae bacterium]
MKRIISALVVLALGAVLGVGANFGYKSDGVKDENLSKAWYLGEDEEVLSVADYNLDDYVTLGDYKSLKVESQYTKVTDKEVEQYINQMLQNYPDYVKVNKKTVAQGDTIELDYKGTIDGEAFDGGTAEDQHLAIGSGTMIDGFEDQLVDSKVGDTVEVKVTFPDDYQSEDLQGKDAVFEVKVKAIVKEVYYDNDTVTDEFVQKNLGQEDVKAMRDYVKDYCKGEADKQKESNARTAVVAKAVEISKVKIPEELLDYKVRAYLSSLRESCEKSNSTVSEYLTANFGGTTEDFEAQVKTSMEESLKNAMVLYDIASKEKIEASKDEFESYVDAFVSYYGYDDKEGLYKDYPEKELKVTYVSNMVTDYLVKNADISYVLQNQDESTSK